MKKIIFIGLAIVTMALLVAGAVVPALAHSGDSNIANDSAGYIDGPTLSRVAESLGLTAEDLSADLQAGQTLTEIAQNQNVAEETVVEAIVAPYAEQLALRVQYEYLTQEEADTFLETAHEHAHSLLEQNLSITGENSDSWQEMEDFCDEMMSGGMMGSGSGGGMMGGGSGGGMMGGGFGGGMMGGW